MHAAGNFATINIYSNFTLSCAKQSCGVPSLISLLGIIFPKTREYSMKFNATY